MYIQINPEHKDYEPIVIESSIAKAQKLTQQLINNLKEIKKGVAKLHFNNAKTARGL